ncbi:hypothetical protein BKA70DRAFT_1420761 [Coprinopsis sp. MPI-PUGE-AT-0042]|nr:hypothetical protein BKA70DRAFT_1420761 [Coprinopsis sp. MPI-PUGE-AT-0042]
MPKLKFKDDPDEPPRKHKRKKKRPREDDTASHSSSKRRHTPTRKWASSDEDVVDPAAASSSKHSDDYTHSRQEKPDYDTLRAEMEDQAFREKMFDALGDDERLDGIEAQMNDFAHVPDRWRSAATGPDVATSLYDEDDFLKRDPALLDDEEKTHAAEHAERLRRKAEAAERAAQEKARRRERRRLEREAEEERRQKKQDRRIKRMDDARAEYQARWKALLVPAETELNFHDIPWPIVAAYDADKVVLTAEDFSEESISTFLLDDKQERKERLRETFLRFHPDKFEGRFMGRIIAADVDRVRETIGQVSRALNSLLL